MNVQRKNLEKSQVELTITITPEEYTKHLEPAAKRLSERVAVKGFRKGHIPYDVLKKEVGEMAILQEALERIVQEHFVQALKDEQLDTIGAPEIALEKVAPENDIVFKATVALIPEVKLADVKKIKVEKKQKDISDEQVTETIDALRGMHATEVIKKGTAEGTDKLVIDMDMLLDNVAVEGGTAKDYQVYLSEDHYIKGFNDQVKGLKKDDTKEFTLDFPKDHYQKQLAGKNVQFKVKVKDVFERQLPELDADFAKKLGMESVEKLKELIHSNMTNEAKNKAEQQAEIDILDQLIEKSSFDDIPDVLISAEKQKIFYELTRDLEKHGITVEQYLGDLKKTEEELLQDFTTQAEKRAKAALVSRAIAKQQDIVIEEKDIDAEVELMKGAYQNNKEALENLKRREVRDSIATMLQNRKVMDYLKKEVLGSEKAPEKKEKTTAKKATTDEKKKK